MKYKINARDRVRSDILEAFTHYGLVSQKISRSFREELSASIDQLKYNPKLYQVRYKSVRIKPMKRFPYGLHYLIEEDTVFIQRLLHFKQSYEQ